MASGTWTVGKHITVNVRHSEPLNPCIDRRIYVCETRHRILQRSQFGANCRRRCKLNSIENQFMPIAVPNPQSPSNSIWWLVTFFFCWFFYSSSRCSCAWSIIAGSIQPSSRATTASVTVRRCESARQQAAFYAVTGFSWLTGWNNNNNNSTAFCDFVGFWFF